MFDADGDGHMSTKEFMVLFRHRRPRGIHKVSSVYMSFIYRNQFLIRGSILPMLGFQLRDYVSDSNDIKVLDLKEKRFGRK